MANYLIGIDFGTSQTKVCLLNIKSKRRRFIKFDDDNYFLPSLIVKKKDNTFSYGNENEVGIKYRYFKMAAAEDEDLIKATNENLDGHLPDGANLDDFRKYSTDNQIKPEILVILYLTYVYLFVKKKKSEQQPQQVGGLLGQLAGNKATTDDTFSINLGIPTEWNNPTHIKRKIKFQSLLIAAVELANQFKNLDSYLETDEYKLFEKISDINKKYLEELNNANENQKAGKVTEWLKKYKLSVFPESAAGVNYLLKTQRLADGCYATLDIGAGTSDIAIFEVKDNVLRKYYCSESVEIAANDFYREYAKQLHQKESVAFEEIREVEKIISNNNCVNQIFFDEARRRVRGFLNDRGIEFAVRKTFYRKCYMPLFNQNQVEAFRVKNELLNDRPIIIFGGGANLEGFCNGNYCFFKGDDWTGKDNRNFYSTPITNFLHQVTFVGKDDVTPFINLLILALGLTYTNLDEGNYNNFIPFVIPENEFPAAQPQNNERYFYYDLQAAVYK